MMGCLHFDSLKEKKPWNFSPQVDVGAWYTNLWVAHKVHSFCPWCYLASLQPWTPQQIKFWSALNWWIDASKFEHMDKWNFWSAFNWSIDVSNSCNIDHIEKSSFWIAFYWPIDVNNSCNFEHLNKLDSWPTFHWPIDVDNSCNFKHSLKWSFWSKFNWQQT